VVERTDPVDNDIAGLVHFGGKSELSKSAIYIMFCDLTK
jgi:hypothetical protein